MSIITKGNVVKGTPAQFTLNKADLLQHSMVQADSYFSDSLNWYRVNLIYKSSVGSQYEIVEFDASQATPTGTFLISEKARDEFQIQKIKIIDFDGGFLEIPRSSLTTSNFDVLTQNSSSVNAVLWVNPVGNAYNIESDGGLTKGSNRGNQAYLPITADSQVFSGDFEIIYNVQIATWDTNFGIETINNGAYSGSVSDVAENNAIHINNNYVQMAPSLNGKEWKIKRIGATTYFYTDNVLNFSTTAVVGPVKPRASLGWVGTAVLLSASIGLP